MASTSILPNPAKFLPGGSTVKSFKCKVQSAGVAELRWRRIQVHEQQSERQRKNILQKVLTFAARARELQCEDMGSKFETFSR